MEIFLDSGDIKQIRKWLPFIDGITTNPSILKKDGSSVADILTWVPKDYCVSVEAVPPFVDETREWTKNPNVAVKIPLLNSDGSNNLAVIKQLSVEGAQINCTALFSLGQVIFAAKAGAKFVSLFGGRIDDEGGDQYEVIRQASDFLYAADLDARIIVGSIRAVSQIQIALDAGAHIITIPPAILDKMLMHRYSIETARQFEEDAKQVKK